MNYSLLAAKSFIFENGVIKEELICSWEIILMHICRRVHKALKVTQCAVGKACFQLSGCRSLQTQASNHS